MKLVSCSPLPLRISTLSRLSSLHSLPLSSSPTPVSLHKHTACSPYILNNNTTTTFNHKHYFSQMPPPPKRKWPRSRGGNRANAADRAERSTGGTGLTQQMKRPKVEDAQSTGVNTINVKELYSTAAGDAAPVPFSDLKGKIDQGLLNGIAKMGFEFMSPVQQKVLTELPTMSSDCIVQAKTGTGKTVAFLLPALQNLLAGNAPPRGKVGILVICPTRELAQQIVKECTALTECLPNRMECHFAVGGTAKASTLTRFMNGNPTVLVATPGRLDDILSEEEVRDRFTHLRTVVLDEADQMLDQGFFPAVKKILRQIPPKSDGWQGMCFSATLPKDVLDVANIVLYPGYTHLSTVDPNEVPTHARVPQFFFSVPKPGDTFAALSALIDTEYNQDPEDFKAIVFGNTANGVGLLYDLYKHVLPQFRLFELHSRMSQTARTKTTQAFKDAARGILFASDVVGRGMDFPNVSLVIQLGLPPSTDQYVHRVGRTARAGKDGRAVLILYEQEAFFPRVNKTLPIEPYPTAMAPLVARHQGAIEKGFVSVEEESKFKAYQAFMGYNKTYLKKLQLTPTQLVRLANEYAEMMGCPEPPLIEKSIVSKMGLKGVPGLRIGSRKNLDG